LVGTYTALPDRLEGAEPGGTDGWQAAAGDQRHRPDGTGGGDRYNALADIEHGFRVLKSEIENGPVYHRLPERIRAHAQICFMVLILARVMRARLHSAHTVLSPERALEHLRRIQHHRIRIAQGEPVTGASAINVEQAGVFSALGVQNGLPRSNCRCCRGAFRNRCLDKQILTRLAAELERPQPD